MTRAPALVLVLVAATAGCMLPTRPPDRTPLDARGGIVFLAHGIWPDGGWISHAEHGIRAAGLEAVHVEYDCFLPGFLTGAGTDAPAERLAAFVRALEARHAATGCKAALRYHAIGYSGGTVVALKAAFLGVRFESVHLGGSPIPAFSPVLADAVRAGRIGRVANYWSLFDGVTGWGWGMAQFGYHGSPSDDGETAAAPGEALAIENVPVAYHHSMPPFDQALANQIARDIASRARGAAAHACFRDPDFWRWFRAQGARLDQGEALPDASAQNDHSL